MIKKTLGVIALGGVTVISGGSLALANNNNNAQLNSLISNTQEYTGSIKINPSEYKNVDIDESQELTGLATITIDEAKKIAEERFNGIISSIELDIENNNLIYAVKINGQEVNIDAGNGSILQIEESDDGILESLEKNDSSDD